MKRRKNQILLYTVTRGGGWVDCVDILEGQSVGEVFRERMSGKEPEHFLVCVNRQPVSLDTVLQEGDRVTIEPLTADEPRTYQHQP